MLRSVVEILKTMERQATKTAKALAKSFGGELAKPLAALRVEAAGFGGDMAEAGERAARAFRADVAAVVELRGALRGVADQQRAAAEAVRASHTAAASAVRRDNATARNAATGRAVAAAGDLDMVRRRWRIREASQRAERREAERAASASAGRDKAEAAAMGRRIGDVGRLWRLRERSEAAELAHMRTVARERAAMRRHAMTSGQHAYGHARHVARSLNHPVYESLGFALSAGAAAGGAFAEHVVRASEAFDTSLSRLKMFAPQLDADAIRRTALGDSIALGIDASTIVDSVAKSVRDGVPPAIAQYLPKSIAQTAQVMGGNIEGLTDSLAEGLQEATSMGWIKDKIDARRFLNLEAGLSTTAGNTSAKTEQFIAAGGLGHGREMGLDLEKTMAFGAMLNASGARTGQASARFMGQLSQNVPKMFDKYRQAAQSHRNSEEDRAVRSAPARLGYGGVREMQRRIMAGPEGLIDFAARLQQLDDKARKLVLEGYGFSEQGGAMLAELGANGGAKGKVVLARAHELAEQKEANDYLSEKFAEWQKSLSFMLKQIEAGWRAIENEIGDVIKSDIIAPFRDWWTLLSENIVRSDMKARMHAAISGFVHGLGFDDVRALLDSLSADARGFDVAGFARGVGEGIRATVDAMRSLGGVFGGSGGLSAELVGRLSAEFFGLSLALRVAAPAVTLLGGVASAVLAIKAAFEGVALLARFTGLADGIRAVVGVETAATAAGLLSVAGGLAAVGAVVQGLLSAGVLNAIHLPKDFSAEEWAKFGWGVRPDGTANTPEWAKRLFGGGDAGSIVTKGAPNPTAESPAAHWARKNRALHPSAYRGGGGDDPNNWRNLLTPASYSPSDSGEVARDAMVGTERGVREVRDAVDRLGAQLRDFSRLGGGDGGDGGGGGGGGGGFSNMRYGRTASGAYRSSPGGRGAGGGDGMTAVSKDLTPESRALLDTLASGEAPDYNVMNGGGRFSDYSHHPGGRAAGRYQFLPSTWRRVSAALGLHDFSPESQDKGAWWLAQQDYKSRTGRSLQADLASKDPARIAAVGRALHPTWVSLNGAFGGKYARYLGRQSAGAVAGGGGGASAPGQVKGNLKIGDETFRYGSGGAGGSASIPFGDYPINPDAPGAWGRAHDAMAVNGTGSIWDKALGRMRTGIEMHAASTAAMVTHGCLGFMRDEYPRLKARVREMIAKTGHAYLHVGPNGATITPDKDGVAAAVKRLSPAGVSKQVAPSASGIAGKVVPLPKPRPATGDAPAGGGTSADNSTVNHNTFHVYGAHDPHYAARAVAGHLDNLSRYSDALAVS